MIKVLPTNKTKRTAELLEQSLPCRCKEHNNRQLLHQILKKYRLGHNDSFFESFKKKVSEVKVTNPSTPLIK